MSKESDYKEYTDIAYVLKSDEWRAWTRFLEMRVRHLGDKVLRLVHAKKFDEAACTEAVIFDIRKQIDAFRNRKGKLEESIN